MNTALWIAQALLAVAFIGSGLSKLLQPYERVTAQMGYAADFTPATVRSIGSWEVLGAIGVVLPALTGILTWLTPLAAGGLAVDMGGAMATHLRRQEYAMIIVNLVLLVFAAFVVYGRLVAVPL